MPCGHTGFVACPLDCVPVSVAVVPFARLTCASALHCSDVARREQVGLQVWLEKFPDDGLCSRADEDYPTLAAMFRLVSLWGVLPDLAAHVEVAAPLDE